MRINIEVHGPDCECEDCTTPIGILIAKRGFKCSDCGHQHTGVQWAYICIGCPCATRPDWATKVDAVDPVGRRSRHGMTTRARSSSSSKNLGVGKVAPPARGGSR